jgi:methionyl-tRNA formyltransferase
MNIQVFLFIIPFMMPDLRIIYMGTPEFAVAPLQELLRKGFNVVAVISAPDKPAGRGRSLQQCAVARFAIDHKLPLLQPANLKDSDFINQLQSFEANLQVVVAFRKLPAVVWQLPEYGTFNLHASLLPHYRGAAPINRVIMNGEKETGLTTFFLTDTIDTGNILFREVVPILPDENAGNLHDRMMEIGARLVVKTAQGVAEANLSPVPQEKFFDGASELKTAPKIFKEDCLIHWAGNFRDIHNQIRGLSPYPGAFTHFRKPDGKTLIVKVFSSHIEEGKPSLPGEIATDGRSYLKIAAGGGFVYLDELQAEGRKRMRLDEFIRGIQINSSWQTGIPIEICDDKTSKSG